MKTYTLEELQDTTLGKIGTPKRDEYEKAFDLKLIALKLKEERKKRHITQQALGEMIGHKKSYISTIENGNKKTPLLTLNKIAGAMGMTIDLNLRPLKEKETATNM